MSAYPSSPAFRYPVTRRLEFETRIATGRNGAEQRTMIHAGRESWDLSYPRLSLTERNVLLAFFDASKGSYAQDIEFSFLGTTFTRCYFAEDTLSFTESEPTVYGGTVKLEQVTRAADSGALPSDFPALANGCITQRPYVAGHAWSTVVVRTEGGRYRRANRAATLRSWSAGGSAITMEEAEAIWDMFRRARGRYHAFAFTDPESGVRYENCRFGADVLEWRMQGPGHSAVEVQIVQFP